MRRTLAGLATLVATALAVAVAPTAASAAGPAWPTLQAGATGDDVATAQYLLRQSGQQLAVDGSFDAETQAAVAGFQKANNLTADGVVSQGTWPALAVDLEPGARNNAVKALQTALNKNGYELTVDGSYAGATTAAVKDFKAKNKLTGGTKVGDTTWQWLTGGGNGSGAYRLLLDKNVLPREAYGAPHHDYPASDLPVNTGTKAYAITSGTVIHVGGGCGLGIGINGDDGAYYQFCHLSERAVAEGARVTPGQLIGLTGSTGNSTGPHLHLEVRIGGANLCPQPLLLALFDGTTAPKPEQLPASGCTN